MEEIKEDTIMIYTYNKSFDKYGNSRKEKKRTSKNTF